MAKKSRIAREPQRTIKTSVPIVLPAKQTAIDADKVKYYPRSVQKRTGRNYFRAAPENLIPAANALGFRLEVRQTKHGKYFSIRLYAQTAEEADRDFRAMFARMKRKSEGFPDTLKYGNNKPEPTKQETRAKRKAKEREAEEKVYLRRLESMHERYSREEIEERLKRVEETSPDSLKSARIGALHLARIRAIEKERAKRVNK